jgi:hypothetical protein
MKGQGGFWIGDFGLGGSFRVRGVDWGVAFHSKHLLNLTGEGNLWNAHHAVICIKFYYGNPSRYVIHDEYEPIGAL